MNTLKLSYLLGAGILYIGCVFGVAQTVSTSFEHKVSGGLVVGSLLWLPCEAVLLLVQYVFKRLLDLRGSRTFYFEIFLLISPAFAFVILTVIWPICRGDEQISTFERLVCTPIPASVSVVQYGKLVGVGGDAYFFFEFNADPQDVIFMLNKSGYSQVQDAGKDVGLQRQQLSLAVQQKTGCQMNLEDAHLHYFFRQGRTENHIFVDTNRTHVFFWGRK